MAVLRQVTEGYRDTQARIDDTTQRAGIAIDSLSLEQQQQMQALRQLDVEIRATGQLSDERADQFWEDLQHLRSNLVEYEAHQREQLHQTVHQESADRQLRQGEIVAEVQNTQSHVQGLHEEVGRAHSQVQGLHDQVRDWSTGALPQWVEERIQHAITQVPSGITTEQIQIVVQAAQQSIMPQVTNMINTLQQSIQQTLAAAQTLPRNDDEFYSRPLRGRRATRARSVPWRNNSPSPSPSPSPPPPSPPPPPPPGWHQAGIGPQGQQFFFQVAAPTTRLHRREAVEPWRFAGDKGEDLRAWLMSCNDYFARNPEDWQQDRDKIIYAIGRTKDKSKAQDFGIQYRREMEGIDGFQRRPAYRYWTTFDITIRDRFLSVQEAQEARVAMQAEKYVGDIGDYILKIKRYNNLVRMTGVTLRGTIEQQLPFNVRMRLSVIPEIDDDDEWMRMVVQVGKAQERFLEDNRLLEALKKGTQKPKEWKEPSRATPVGPSPRKPEVDRWKAVRAAKPEDRFPRPVNFSQLTEAEKKQREERLRGVPEDTIKARKIEKSCIRCGQKGHGQYACPASRPVISTLTANTNTSKKRKVKEEESDQRPSKKATLSTSEGRIWEVQTDEEMEDN